MDIRGALRRFAGNTSREVQRLTRPPLAHWDAQTVTIALEPPVDGRTEVRFEARARNAPMLACTRVLNEDLRPLADEHEWRAIEEQLRDMQKHARLTDEVLVIIAMTGDMTIAARALREKPFADECIERPLRRVIEASFGRDHAAAMVVHADTSTYSALFGRSIEFAPSSGMVQ